MARRTIRAGNEVVEADIYGAFGVHVTTGIYGPFSVTHVPTGLAAEWNVQSVQAGLTLARRLSRLPIPWSRVTAPLVNPKSRYRRMARQCVLRWRDDIKAVSKNGRRTVRGSQPTVRGAGSRKPKSR